MATRLAAQPQEHVNVAMATLSRAILAARLNARLKPKNSFYLEVCITMQVLTGDEMRRKEG